MSKQSLLLVDGDTRSLRVLEVSLRKAGFSVTPAVSVGDALEKLEISPPDLIISETKFSTDLDGFELRRRLRGSPEWAEIPFIFLTAETAIENKIKGLELGVDDYLTKPIYIKEIVTRINILLQKKQRQFLDLRKDGTRFAGRVSDMPVVDVIQTIEVSRKSGVIQFTGGPNRQAAIYFRDGKVIDAEAGTLQAEDAVYRLLTWNEGEFEVEFRTVRRREVIQTSSQGLLMEGMRRLDEWSRLLEQLPPLSHRFEIDAAELAARLGEVPDDNNRILRLFDGKRTLLEVIDASDFGDLECLQAISRLYFEGLLIDLDPSMRSSRDTGRSSVVQVDDKGSGRTSGQMPAQTPMQAATSGQIELGGLEERAASDSTATVTSSDTTATSTAEAPQPPPPMDSTAPVAAADVVASEPVAAPRESGPEIGRPRRDSTQAIDDSDVVDEEVVHGPLAGGYRPSSLRLIDEAVAAAQLIEPSLFADEELAALGIKRATADEVAAAHGAAAAAAAPAEPPAAAVERVKQELRSSDPRIETQNATPVAPPTPSGPNGANGRARGKTLPPPIPRTPKRADVSEEVPLLDSSLLSSGEHKIPDELDDETPLLDSSLLTSGEFTIPSDAAIAAARSSAPSIPPRPPAVTVAASASEENGSSPTPSPSDINAKLGPVDVKASPPGTPQLESEDYSGVPTVIEAEGNRSAEEEPEAESPDVRATDPQHSPVPLPPADDAQAARMIGSYGRDRAEASGELRRPPSKPEDTAQTQRELVTILPRRKTGEVTQLKAEEEVSTLDSKGQLKAKAVVAELEANAAKAAAAAESTAEARAEDARDADDKPAAKPAVESPSRKVAAAGSGVVAPDRGPSRGVQILIALASIAAGALVYSQCKKSDKRTTPIATVQQDASMIVTATPDAPDFAFGPPDADVAMTPPDAATVAVARPDAAVPVARPDAAVVAMVPDAAVPVARPDAAVVVINPPTGDAGVAAPDKGKEAAALATKARAALAEGEAQQALDLFDQALKLKKDKRTYVDRGRALHNLGRTDEAVASIDEAIKMSESYAQAWEQKGKILWSAQRYGEARTALEMYLQLQPDGPSAETIRKMLDEPR